MQKSNALGGYQCEIPHCQLTLLTAESTKQFVINSWRHQLLFCENDLSLKSTRCTMRMLCPLLLIQFLMANTYYEYCSRILPGFKKLSTSNVIKDFLDSIWLRFLYKDIIIKHNKTEPTYTKTSLFLCEKRRFFMARTEKGVVATI